MQYLKTYLFLATIAIVLSFSTCSNSNKIEKEEKYKTFSFDSLYLRPTDTSDIHFDFNRDIYGKKLVIRLEKFLRGEVKFNGLDELKAQLNADRTQARQVFMP